MVSDKGASMKVSATPSLAITAGVLAALSSPAYPQTGSIARSQAGSFARAGGLPFGPRPAIQRQPPEVAPLFEQPGVLTPKGKTVLEPSLHISSTSSNRTAVLGYSAIPNLFPGFVNVREVKRHSLLASLTARHGVSNRFEVELKIPYVYRKDRIASASATEDSGIDRVFRTEGEELGDIEVAALYQFNEGGKIPYFVGNLRVKTRTGRDPFRVVTDCLTRCVDRNSGTGLSLESPTGSGFNAVEPGLTWFMSSDPIIYFGTFSYMHAFKRKDLRRTVLNGEQEVLGEIAPGAAFGANLGLGWALSDRISVSIGYDHVSIKEAKQNGTTVPGSVRLRLDTVMTGFSYRIDKSRTINLSLASGLSKDAPDLSFQMRMPFTF